MCDGSFGSGPWAPPTVPTPPAVDGHQQLGLGAPWGGVGAAFPFWLDGRVWGPPLVYCTAKTTSCGSTPTLDGPAATASATAGAGTFDVTLGPVNAFANDQAGILIYSTLGANPKPFLGVFGWHCINETAGFLLRVPPPVLPTGTGCGGRYTFDFGLFLATQTADPNLVAGAGVDMQAWYRDPPTPDAASLSNAMRIGLVP